MSRQDVEIVRRSFDAWNEGDVEAIRRIYTEDVVVAGGSGLGGSLGGGDPIGRWVADVASPAGRRKGRCTGPRRRCRSGSVAPDRSHAAAYRRARLCAVAYRFLGSVTEADDTVREAWLRLSRSDPSEIENLGGWRTTVVADGTR
jgi:hypothetical protein